MGNVIIEVFQELGRQDGIKIGEEHQKEAIARNMLSKGFKLSDIIETTSINIDRLGELKDEMNVKSVLA